MDNNKLEKQFAPLVSPCDRCPRRSACAVAANMMCGPFRQAFVEAWERTREGIKALAGVEDK